jgi:hypothetical protein
VKDVITEMLTAKGHDGLNADYIQRLRYDLNAFANCEFARTYVVPIAGGFVPHA